MGWEEERVNETQCNVECVTQPHSRGLKVKDGETSGKKDSFSFILDCVTTEVHPHGA